MFRTLATGLAFALGAVPAAQADPEPGASAPPDHADLMVYILCSDLAAERPLGMAEAVACGRVFDRVKLAFVPGVTPEEYAALPTREQASVNLVGYARFRAWYDANPARIEGARAQIRSIAGAAPAGG